MLTFFIVLTVIGFALVLLTVVFDDVLDGLLGGLDMELESDWFSSAVVGAALFTFGGIGWITTYNESTVLTALVLAGLAAYLAGKVTTKVVQAAVNMPTDPTPRTEDLVGSEGTVVIPIPAGGTGYGQILVNQAGQRIKLSARCENGAEWNDIVIIHNVLSPTAVSVTTTNRRAS